MNSLGYQRTAVVNNPTIKSSLILALVGLVASGLLIVMSATPSSAADMSKFDPANIMDDAVMSNKGALNEQQIQAFLDNRNKCKTNPKNPAGLVTINADKTEASYTSNGTTYRYYMDNGKFICLADQKFNGESAARIIYQAAQEHTINPQVLIALLEKEQGLISDNWPNYNVQYRSATGYGCPDTAACDTQYYGFKNQVRNAARFFRVHLDNAPGWYKPYTPGNNRVYFHPGPYNAGADKYYGSACRVGGKIVYDNDCPSNKRGTEKDIRHCGSTSLNIKNRTTSALYSYTPYQPNQAALNAGYGTGNICSSYGNRNFWGLFTDWFGSTVFAIKGAIGDRYEQLGAQTGVLGSPVSNQSCSLIHGGCYQSFQNGAIYWTKNTGAWSVRGGIRGYWANLGYEKGRLGYPINDEICGLKDGGCMQSFQGGKVYWTPQDGARHIWGAIEKNWDATGYEFGTLGYPMGTERCGLVGGGCFQQFQGGSIYWSPKSNAHYIKGSIFNKWATLNYEFGRLGYPLNDETCGLKNGGCFQQFQGGKIYWTASTGSQHVWGGIEKKWDSTGYEWGALGYPTSSETCGLKNGGCFQQFQGGSIYWTAQTNSHITKGTIRDKWNSLNRENSQLGYPTKDEVCGLKENGCFQQFQGGKIYVTPTGGAQSIWGAIERKWDSLDYERSPLGYPTSGEQKDTDSSTFQQFQKGRIYWTQAKGAWVQLTK